LAQGTRTFAVPGPDKVKIENKEAVTISVFFMVNSYFSYPAMAGQKQV
jgi:hypothetical protein